MGDARASQPASLPACQPASDSLIDHIFKTVRTIAVVGFSNNPSRPSHYVAACLQQRGYRVVPVNPGLDGQEFLGETVYKDLKSIRFPVDMVDIFRNSDAAGRAEAAGLAVAMDRCPKIELGRR